MWSDSDTNVDLIDFSHLVQGVKGIIDNKDLTPSTIGVFGDWGSGKSSLLKMVEEEFNHDDKVLIVKFNGWLFEGYEDAKTALMTTIVEKVISKRTLSNEAIYFAKNLLKQIDWLKLAKYGAAHGIAFMTTGGFGNAIIEMQRIASEKLSDPKKINQEFQDGDYDDLISKISGAAEKKKSPQLGVRGFHQNLGKLLNETKINKLMVFIDDLDRCTPDTVIATLEAIKLFLYAQNTVFVISADERLIKYAVRKRFPEIPGDATEVGRDYLEKLIQFPVRIPSLSESEIETYLNLLFAKMRVKDQSVFESIRNKALEKKGDNLFGSIFNSSSADHFFEGKELPPELIDDLVLSAQITPILGPGMNGNPRQCKRFLNTLLMRFDMANSKGIALQKKVLAKIMLLEYFKPETFRSLSRLQNNENGYPSIIKSIEATEVNATDGDTEPSEEVNSWVSDPWLNTWFKSEPKLSKIDLRTYFFFSRDRLGSIGLEANRMSSEAQDVYQKLVSESDSINKRGISGIENLSDIDTASIFSAITTKIREEEDKTRRSNHLKVLCLCVEKRTSLTSELVDFLKNISENLLSSSIVPQAISALKNTNNEPSLKILLMKWAKSSNKRLAKTSNSKLLSQN